ncbi:protein arginine kinase [Desulfosporosinus meridiei]|uniref:Protein-arginine kinase n=1 Tax=Desulfosporosinus meridiei (strain ATCC BAA-275 / DSM 13257 / KCTC 12902 / NCIMB 13706 / S10) TaxID=768704 RepID=J7IQ36_DESMD|nr:protein arginine kinase [Desulfosporosinus meridiei]AFQ42274.1 arginine kinase [Desulfosporosinus meridiei DSM 13257]
MIRKELLLQHSAWMSETDSPVVISSRVRLARNLEDFPFPHGLNSEGAAQVEKTVAKVLTDNEGNNVDLIYIPLTELNTIEQQVLIEKHLISPSLGGATGARGVALAPDHRYAVMVNEEDHLRIQVLLPGNQLLESHRLATGLDDLLEAKLDFAYRESQGYLTSCPTNVGTGLRASVMVHLPGLVITKQVQQVLGAVTRLGLAVRGLYGEGSQAFGHIYQISNQITLGKSEEDILSHLDAVTGQIVEHELQARDLLRRQTPMLLEDKVWRARGTLQNARLLSSEDAMHLLSHDRLGTDMGLLPKTKDCFATLIVDTRPGCLQYILDRELDPGLRDQERARLVRERIA